MPKFNVTFERVTPESAIDGDVSESGFVLENVSLSEAIQRGLEYSRPEYAGYCEPSDSHAAEARWLTFYEWNHNTREHIETGMTESRSLHIPDCVTRSSRIRIMRLFGVKI